jgi:glyoxylase-like metal-dependent hydrolase (beta-lactamase superfamily II)
MRPVKRHRRLGISRRQSISSEDSPQNGRLSARVGFSDRDHQEPYAKHSGHGGSHIVQSRWEDTRMKRCLLLAGLIGIGMLSLNIVGLQAPSPAALTATKIEKVKDNLYIITGSNAGDTNSFSGGNTAVFITETGVVLVDTKLPGWGPTVVERVKSVTNKPITTIINTHTHADHTGSNEFFGTMVNSVVHENTKENMAKMDDFKGEKARFLPKRTYRDKMTIGKGKDEVDLYYFGRGHTNGDTFVVFPALRTMHAGDMFAWKALPYIDPMNGGSVVNHPQSLARAAAALKDVDTVITGHIPLATWNEFKEYGAFTQDFVDFARNAFKANKTVEQAAKEYKVPAKYKGYVETVNPQFGNAHDNLEIAYGELKK